MLHSGIDLHKGMHVSKMRDKTGEKMSDAYLVRQLARDASWLPQVYDRANGYIHLSAAHFANAIRWESSRPGVWRGEHTSSFADLEGDSWKGFSPLLNSPSASSQRT